MHLKITKIILCQLFKISAGLWNFGATVLRSLAVQFLAIYICLHHSDGSGKNQHIEIKWSK